MKKLMVLVVLLAVALIAAPAIAQNEDESTIPESTPVEGPPGDVAEPPSEPPTSADSAPAAPPSADPSPAAPTSADPVPEPATPETLLQGIPSDDGGPVSDTSGDDTSSIPSEIKSTDPSSDVADGPNVADGPASRTRDDVDDDTTKDEITDGDEVEAEAREDRIADNILAQPRDGKKDRDDEDDDKDNDEDDDNDEDKNDVEQNQDQDADSGDVDQDADVINTGDNVNQCVGILQVANTGNAQNATGITQYDSEADEIELENGSRVTLTPQLVVDCRQIILQIVRGERPNESKISKARLREVVRPTSGATLANQTGAGVIVPSSRSGITATPKVLSASSAGRPAGQPRNSAKSLPRTGGSYATLLGLGTGALLVGGGLLVRRLAR